MANSVDQLFDKIYPEIENELINPDWKKTTPEDYECDVFEEPPDGFRQWEDVRPLEEEIFIDRTFDRILDGRFPPIEIDDEDNELVEGAIRSRGFDVLAFYKSKRFSNQYPFAGKWGIFYFKTGLLYVAGKIQETYPAYKDPRALAREFLFEHEFFHYKCDLQSLMYEAALSKNLYVSLRRALRGQQSHFVEEAMANRAAYQWAKQSRIGLEEFAFDFMKLQPDAYARFDEPRLSLNGEWLVNTLNLQPPGSTPRTDIAEWADSVPKNLIRKSLCPQYVIYLNKASDWFSPALVLPPVAAIVDGDDVTKKLKGKYRHLVSKWQATKQKLIADRTLMGLNFKPWRKDGENCYSVRIDRGYRAHLRHEGKGNWIAYILGSHKETGHG